MRTPVHALLPVIVDRDHLAGIDLPAADTVPDDRGRRIRAA